MVKGGCNLKLADCWWRSVVVYCGAIYKRPFLSHLCTDAKPANLTLLHVINLIATFLSENFKIEIESCLKISAVDLNLKTPKRMLCKILFQNQKIKFLKAKQKFLINSIHKITALPFHLKYNIPKF